MPRKVRKPNFYESRRRKFYPPVENKVVEKPKPKKSLDEVLAEYRTKG